MSRDFDVIVVGCGLVGASFALALAPAGLSVAVIEPGELAPAADPDDLDVRIYAVSPGSAAFLDSCGAWAGVALERRERVETMRIFGDVASGRLEFSAYDSGLPELAWIVENRELQQALWARLQEAHHVSVFRPARCADAQWEPERVCLQLADGTELRARLLVGADGAESWVRQRAGMACEPHDYGHVGVVANFATEHPHEGVAFQWFLSDGVLALLPLPGRRVSMVWSAPAAHAELLLQSGPAELAEKVEAASGGVLGSLRLIGPAAGFPLRLLRVPRLIAPRVALIGDAAHNVHPLAGQGVNLGFRDARELAAVLAARGPQADCGDYRLLRRYERARREDIAALQFTTDALQKLFAVPSVWTARLRNFGLRAVDAQPLLKRLLVEHAVA